MVALVSRGEPFVTGSHHQRGDPEHGPPVGSCRRREGAIAAMNLIEVIDDGAAVDQSFAVIEDQCRNPAKGIAAAHVGAVAEA